MVLDEAARQRKTERNRLSRQKQREKKNKLMNEPSNEEGSAPYPGNDAIQNDNQSVSRKHKRTDSIGGSTSASESLKSKLGINKKVNTVSDVSSSKRYDDNSKMDVVTTTDLDPTLLSHITSCEFSSLQTVSPLTKRAVADIMRYR